MARAQSHVGRVRRNHTAVVLDDGTLYTFGMAALVNLGMEMRSSRHRRSAWRWRRGKGAKSRRSRAAKSHGRGLGRRHTVHVRSGGMVNLGMEIRSSRHRRSAWRWRRGKGASHVGRVRRITRPWSWTTAHCTRSVMAAMVNLGMEIRSSRHRRSAWNWTLRSSSALRSTEDALQRGRVGARVLLGRKRGPWRIRLARRCSCSSK